MAIEKDELRCPVCGLPLREGEHTHAETLMETSEAGTKGEGAVHERDSAEIAELREREAARTESELRRVQTELSAHEEQAIEQVVFGDFVGCEFTNEQISLTPEEAKELAEKSAEFFEEVKASSVALMTGYEVAGSYDTQVKGWTTRTKILEVAGKKVFALCSYPASRVRRIFDRFMERVSGDPMRKPKPQDWKRTVESRSNIPTIAGTPGNMVLMPYIESINAYDLFANQREIKNFGQFEWAKTMNVEDRLSLIEPMVHTLAKTHAKGKTWGEAILPNFIFTKDLQPILVDPETSYERIPVLEQRAIDLRNFITSVSGALARAEGFMDFKRIAAQVIEAHDDSEVAAELARVVSRPLPWRQRLTFGMWGKFRIGSTDLKEYERVRAAIRDALENFSAR